MIKETVTQLDRSKSPEYRLMEGMELIRATERRLSNGIPVYAINGGREAAVKLEFIFPAGIWYEEKVNLAHAVNTLINNGSKGLNAAEIAEKIDYYGAFLHTEINYDHGILSLYCLNKHLDNVLPIISEIVLDAVYPEDELQVYKQNSKQRLQVNLQKNDYLARKHLTHLLFGGDHPYGCVSTEKDYDLLTRDDLVRFYSKHYVLSGCTIIASGNINEKVYALLERYLGNVSLQDTAPNDRIHIVSSDESSFYLHKKEALQSAIRVGKLLFNRTHPDYIGFQVLNTVLGGYFGSRLMSNIREDKGYTYGVGAGIVSMLQAGYFFIGTEVGCEVTEKALKEIYKEIDILRVQPVPAEELDLVRNYMIGTFMGSLENIFAYADKFKNIHFYGLGYDFYDNFFHTIKTITSEQLMELANNYFQADSLRQVVVGKK